MRIRRLSRASTTLSTAAVVALATIMLDACGPDDSSSATSTSRSADTPSPSARSAAATALPDTGASANPGAAPAYGANAADTASDPAQSAQASLAADSQQVAPVMSYAPGDGAQTEASSGNDSSSTATSSH